MEIRVNTNTLMDHDSESNDVVFKICGWFKALFHHLQKAVDGDGNVVYRNACQKNIAGPSYYQRSVSSKITLP